MQLKTAGRGTFKDILALGGYKENQGESVKVSQNRAALFGMTLDLLMLLYMVGSEFSVLSPLRF